MAVDTPNRRVAAIAVPGMQTLPIPGGAISQGERGHLVGYYSGIFVEDSTGVTTPEVVALVVIFRSRMR